MCREQLAQNFITQSASSLARTRFSTVKMLTSTLFLFVLLSFCKFSDGQPLSSDHRKSVEEALMEQRILSNIRHLVMDRCNGQSSTDQLSKLQDLNNRVKVLEELICKDTFNKTSRCHDAFVFEGGCYCIAGAIDTWTEAQARCQSVGTNLVSVENQQLIVSIFNVLFTVLYNASGWWVGVRKTGDTFRRVNDGTIIDDDDTNWDLNQPTGRDGFDCVYNYHATGKWRDSSCTIEDDTIYSLCQR